MTYNVPKSALLAFLFTAMFYVAYVSFITYPLTTLLKPLPIACLIIGVLQTDIARIAKILLVSALSCSLLGDIVLTLPVSLVLEFGIGFFLLAHCFYITLFLKAFQYRTSHLVYFVPVFSLMVFSAVILIPYLGSLMIPVIIYFCILMLMIFSAFQVSHEGLIIGAGAICFMISDLSLAFNLFAYQKVDGRIFIIFTYYTAQLLLTWGLVALYKKNVKIPTMKGPRNTG